MTFHTLTPPEAVAGAATALSTSSVHLAGTVRPHGSATDYHFEWGPTSAYGNASDTLASATTSACCNTDHGSLVVPAKTTVF